MSQASRLRDDAAREENCSAAMRPCPIPSEEHCDRSILSAMHRESLSASSITRAVSQASRWRLSDCASSAAVAIVSAIISFLLRFVGLALGALRLVHLVE